MKHRANSRFWDCYHALPEDVRNTADRNYELLKQDPQHPSLHFKRVGDYWSVRIGIHYRALAIDDPEGPIWFWIGSHAEYDQLIS